MRNAKKALSKTLRRVARLEAWLDAMKNSASWKATSLFGGLRNYWSAENVRKVWARGVEISGEQDITAGKVRLLFKESYAYTLSTNENEISGNDEAYKKQLIYTPVHKGLFKAYIGWKGFGVTVRNTITGKVYTTRDNSSELPGYYLLDVIITKKWFFGGRFPVSFAINANNLLNEEYQVTPFRPMPGISIVGSATLDLNILKNK